MKHIVRIEARGEPVLDQPREDRRVQGAPLRRTWWAHEAQGVSSGIWSCEPGRWRIAFAPNKQEFFHVLEGRVRLHDASGRFDDIGPGEAAMIPPGFEGEFEVLEPVRKHFVVVET
jgi:hypothetical protein